MKKIRAKIVRKETQSRQKDEILQKVDLGVKRTLEEFGLAVPGEIKFDFVNAANQKIKNHDDTAKIDQQNISGQDLYLQL